VGNSYNGYSWKEREAILHEHKRLVKQGNLEPLSYLQSGPACAVCADPTSTGWHSEDYSLPFIFKPPATFAVCAACHLRIHKRFQAAHEWQVFLVHLRCGGYAREFTSMHSKKQRDKWVTDVQGGKDPTLSTIRARALTGSEWWQHLTLDRESLQAAWARPRPFRARPAPEAYQAAIAQLTLTSKETAMLVAHANSPKRAATMRYLSEQAYSSSSPSVANAQYGSLAHRLCELLAWAPDKRQDGSSIWMTSVAEGWQPKGKEFEWVMVPTLAALYKHA
jgi:hypothetical protein